MRIYHLALITLTIIVLAIVGIMYYRTQSKTNPQIVRLKCYEAPVKVDISPLVTHDDAIIALLKSNYADIEGLLQVSASNSATLRLRKIQELNTKATEQKKTLEDLELQRSVIINKINK